MAEDECSASDVAGVENGPSGNNSTHKVEIVRIPTIEKHPNADQLGIVNLWGGYPVIVQLGEFQEGDLAAYVPPDSILPDTPDWAFLKGHRRIRAKRLRGIISVGLMVRAPAGALEGEDVAEQLGIAHYEPKLKGSGSSGMKLGGEDAPAPPGFYPTYDMESLRRYTDVFLPGEEVIVTCKLHGTSYRLAISDGEMFIGSHKRWKKCDQDNLWNRVITPEMRDLVRVLPSKSCLYGEVFGGTPAIQKGFSYGLPEPAFALFDVWTKGQWLCYDEQVALAAEFNVPTVPLLFRGSFDLDTILSLAEGPSIAPGADHIREGCVVRPPAERYDRRCGRVVLKAVGMGYWEINGR